MKLLYDHQIIEDQRYGGVSKYFSELWKCFEESKEPQFQVSITYSNNIFLRDLTSIRYKEYNLPANKAAKRIKLEWIKYCNKKKSKEAITQKDYDIFHPCYYDPYFLPSLMGKPFVLTVHDMIHEIYADDFRASKRARSVVTWKKELCALADRIICVSHSTKKDLVKKLLVDPDKVKVIHLGGALEAKEHAGVNTSLQLPEKYILFVGERNGYKNFSRFYKAVLPLLSEEENLSIVCTGKQFTAQELKMFNHDRVGHRFVHFFADPEELYSLYNGAEFFIFPSEYEGFGIPVVEAMSAGCPMLLSNCSSLPEVGGDAALYFDPHSVEDMSETMSSLYYDGGQKEILTENGKNRVGNFSWNKMALSTYKTYQEILN